MVNALQESDEPGPPCREAGRRGARAVRGVQPASEAAATAGAAAIAAGELVAATAKESCAAGNAHKPNKSGRRRASGAPRQESYDRIANGVLAIKTMTADIKALMAEVVAAIRCPAIGRADVAPPLDGDNVRVVVDEPLEEDALLATPPRTTSRSRQTPPAAVRGWEMELNAQWEALPAVPSFPAWGASGVSGATAMLATSPVLRVPDDGAGGECVTSTRMVDRASAAPSPMPRVNVGLDLVDMIAEQHDSDDLGMDDTTYDDDVREIKGGIRVVHVEDDLGTPAPGDVRSCAAAQVPVWERGRAWVVPLASHRSGEHRELVRSIACVADVTAPRHGRHQGLACDHDAKYQDTVMEILRSAVRPPPGNPDLARPSASGPALDYSEMQLWHRRPSHTGDGRHLRVTTSSSQHCVGDEPLETPRKESLSRNARVSGGVDASTQPAVGASSVGRWWVDAQDDARSSEDDLVSQAPPVDQQQERISPPNSPSAAACGNEPPADEDERSVAWDAHSVQELPSASSAWPAPRAVAVRWHRGQGKRDPATAELPVDAMRDDDGGGPNDDEACINKCIDLVVDKLGYSAAMRTLTESREALGMPRHALLAALRSTNGLAHPARRILQEQHRQMEPQGSE